MTKKKSIADRWADDKPSFSIVDSSPKKPIKKQVKKSTVKKGK